MATKEQMQTIMENLNKENKRLQDKIDSRSISMSIMDTKTIVCSSRLIRTLINFSIIDRDFGRVISENFYVYIFGMNEVRANRK